MPPGTLQQQLPVLGGAGSGAPAGMVRPALTALQTHFVGASLEVYCAQSMAATQSINHP